MKKLINTPESLLEEFVKGLTAANSNLLEANYAPVFVYRKNKRVNKVAIISGGGSGHEPLHCGYIGEGMLDAACPGAVFTSPTPDQVYEAAKRVDSGKGVFLIVKNYTGDILNFEMAADLLSADGIKVASVVVNDDVAVKDSLYTAGRRGVGATVILEKIVGAAAEKGASLDEIKTLAEHVNANSRSIGIALTPCTVPHVGKPSFHLEEDEYEFGIGIHGEPGREKLKMETSGQIADRMLNSLYDDFEYNENDEVLLFVNSMGGTPEIELFAFYGIVEEMLSKKGVKVERNLVGPYITSLEMAGVSVTLLKLDNKLKELWDYPVYTPAFRW